jgi:3-phenylpropionate/trans-cinnamate dioxygenase ferredoxin component
MSSKWVDVGGANELSETEPFAVFVEGFAIAVVRCGEQVYAVQDQCTHDGETLGNAQVEDCQIICPRHGAHFCLKSGQALTPPAYEPLQTFPARLENGRVFVELPG